MPVLLSEDYTYPLPELCKVQQIFDRTLLEDVEGTLKRELAKKAEELRTFFLLSAP